MVKVTGLRCSGLPDCGMAFLSDCYNFLRRELNLNICRREAPRMESYSKVSYVRNSERNSGYFALRRRDPKEA